MWGVRLQEVSISEGSTVHVELNGWLHNQVEVISNLWEFFFKIASFLCLWPTNQLNNIAAIFFPVGLSCFIIDYHELSFALNMFKIFMTADFIFSHLTMRMIVHTCNSWWCWWGKTSFQIVTIISTLMYRLIRALWVLLSIVTGVQNNNSAPGK